jgi:hypothetical protein
MYQRGGARKNREEKKRRNEQGYKKETGISWGMTPNTNSLSPFFRDPRVADEEGYHGSLTWGHGFQKQP